MTVVWLHTTICNYRAKLKLCVTKTVPDEFPGLQIEDAEREATQELLAILVGLTDGGKFNWSEAVSNPVIHDDFTGDGFHITRPPRLVPPSCSVS